MIAEELENDREIRDSKPREISNYVVSRWYRAPEIILMEKNYDTAVDMWSLGCVLAGMLTCICSEGSQDLVLF